MSNRLLRGLVAIGIGGALACQTKVVDAPPALTNREADVAPASVPKDSGIHALVLGRLIDLRTSRELQTLTAPPEQELNELSSDLAIARGRDHSVEAFRLSTGERLWSDITLQACYQVALGAQYVYVQCVKGLFAYDKLTGQKNHVYKNNDIAKFIYDGRTLALVLFDGRVQLVDPTSFKVRAEKILREFAGSRADTRLVSSPTGSGICAAGEIHDDDADTQAHVYLLGCYDEKLHARWSRKTHFTILPGERHFHIRHVGHRFMVFDDQWTDEDNDERPSKIGRGAIIDLVDGSETAFDDSTFATLESPQHERVTDPTLLKVFSHDVSSQRLLPNFAHDDAWIASDAARSFVLMRRQRYAAISAVDWASNSVLFWRELPLGPARTSIEVVDGKPIARTVVDDEWRATVYDPMGGALLYEGGRPWE